MNAIMPYMMRGRNESAVYYEKEIDMENALRYVRAKNSALRGAMITPPKPLKSGTDGKDTLQDRYSLFALILAAGVRTVALRPMLNRFIHRRSLYQRNHLAISFIVKQKMTDDAPEANAKVFFDPKDGLEDVTRKVNEAIRYARQYGEGDGERIAKFFHAIPGGKALIMSLYRLADKLNIAPWALIKTDPLFSTAYFANLGSLGLDTPFHHLYEWGNASFFLVVGKLFQKETHHGVPPVRHHFINFKVTLDERVADGFYFAGAASFFYKFLTHPELLEKPFAELEESMENDISS
jgi:hypothetical protein